MNSSSLHASHDCMADILLLPSVLLPAARRSSECCNNGLIQNWFGLVVLCQVWACLVLVLYGLALACLVFIFSFNTLTLPNHYHPRSFHQVFIIIYIIFISSLLIIFFTFIIFMIFVISTVMILYRCPHLVVSFGKVGKKHIK